MSVFPPELLSKIFQFACTDGGATGRALSLVSCAFHDLVQEFALQSLAIVGPKTIIRFLYMLEHNPAARGAILYLHLSSEHPRIASCSSFRETDNDWNVMVSGGYLSALDSAMTRSGTITVQHIEHAVTRIIDFVGLNLVTLSLHFTFLTRPSLLPQTPMPRLEQLLTYGNHQSSHLRTPKFPSLWYLHISSPISYAVSELYHRAPALTHLYISEKCFTIDEIAKAISIINDPTLTQPDRAVPFPQSLTNIFFEVKEKSLRRADESSPTSDPQAVIDKSYRIDRLKRQAEEISILTGLYINIVPKHSDRWDDIAVAMKDWEERILLGPETGKGWRFGSGV